MLLINRDGGRAHAGQVPVRPRAARTGAALPVGPAVRVLSAFADRCLHAQVLVDTIDAVTEPHHLLVRRSPGTAWLPKRFAAAILKS